MEDPPEEKLATRGEDWASQGQPKGIKKGRVGKRRRQWHPTPVLLRNIYRLTWVSLTLGVGYLFTAAPAKRSHCSLPWTRGISSPPPFLTFKWDTYKVPSLSQWTNPWLTCQGNRLWCCAKPLGKPRNTGVGSLYFLQGMKVRKGGGEEIPLVQGKE